ncbi:MAG: hypothetical protein K0S18_450 [Anaerocolumna sp.]|jgi:YegS/Rv2252/BmrU family lipid kinase|nr:hypothetical protein [Anaerocolumna sp.]
MYHFIVNPHSRSKKGIEVWNVVQRELKNQNVPYEVYYTRNVLHATEIAGQICSNGSDVKKIIILGGDGTVNEVINGIPDFDKVLLGYIPSGSSNDLARSLCLPKDPLESLNRILSPRNFKYVDIGVISIDNTMGNPIQSRKFAVSTGTGFDAAICEEILQTNLKSTLNKFGLGKFSYLIVAIKQLLTAPFLQGTVTIDGNVTKKYKDILLITSMIHKFEGGGLKLVPSANPTDGKLSVCIVSGLSRGKLLFLLPTLLFGKHIYFKGVETFHCKTLEIHTELPAKVHVDGEYPGSYKLFNISCFPKQLRIMN